MKLFTKVVLIGSIVFLSIEAMDTSRKASQKIVIMQEGLRLLHEELNQNHENLKKNIDSFFKDLRKEDERRHQEMLQVLQTRSWREKFCDLILNCICIGRRNAF